MSHPGHAKCQTCGGSIFRENATSTRWYHLDSGVGTVTCNKPRPAVTDN